MTENCLIEITVQFFKAGEPYWADRLLDSYLWQSEPQVLPIKKATDNEPTFWDLNLPPQDIYFEADICSFSFRVFGQNTIIEGWSSPFDWLIDTIGIDEVFKDWLPDLEKMALSILGEANKSRMTFFNPEPLSSYINFVTAWQYQSSHMPETSYSGEDYEYIWELLGAVDLSKIPFSIMPMEDNNANDDDNHTRRKTGLLE